MRDDWRKAASEGDVAAMHSLLAEGVDVDSRVKYGQTALMLAALHGRGEVVDLLLQHHADLDVTAKYQLSALMLAVLNHHSEIARLLVGAGANTRMRGSGAPGLSGRTATDLAEDAGLSDLATYLASHDGPPQG